MAECSDPHSTERDKGNRGVKRGRTEGAGPFGDTKEIREIWRSEAVNGLKGKS